MRQTKKTSVGKSTRGRQREETCEAAAEQQTQQPQTTPAAKNKVGRPRRTPKTPEEKEKRPVGRPRKSTKTPEQKEKRPVGRPRKEKFDITGQRDAPGMIGDKPKVCPHGGAVYDVPIVKKDNIPDTFKRNNVTDAEYVDYKKLKGQNRKGSSTLDLNSVFNLEDTEIYDSSTDDEMQDEEKDPENIRFFQNWVYHGRTHGRGGGVAGSKPGRKGTPGKAYWTKGMLNTLGLAINGERDSLRGRNQTGASKKMYHPTRTFCWDRVAGMCVRLHLYCVSLIAIR